LLIGLSEEAAKLGDSSARFGDGLQPVHAIENPAQNLRTRLVPLSPGEARPRTRRGSAVWKRDRRQRIFRAGKPRIGIGIFRSVSRTGTHPGHLESSASDSESIA